MNNVKGSSIILGLLFLSIGILAWTVGPMPESIPTTESQSNQYEEALARLDLSSKMSNYGVPGVSFGVIRDGKIDWAKGYGLVQVGGVEKIDTETLFSVGSVSKVGASVMTLKMYNDGKIDIDKDVNQYLTSWKVPDNQYTQEQAVTLRHIMSHTAGLTVHGFADFNPGEDQPTTVQILEGEWPAKSNRVYVNIPVGSRFRYSGGGTTVEQMLFEDLTGMLFHKAADQVLFEPLGMNRSTYENPVPESTKNIAKAHNRNGRPVALPRGYQSMPEAAASGLWTNPTDFSKLMIMLMNAYEGEGNYLGKSIVEDMMTPVAPSEYGLGPKITTTAADVLFQHGGSNESYKAKFVGSLNSKNGIIIFTNGARGSELINEVMPVFEEMLF